MAHLSVANRFTVNTFSSTEPLLEASWKGDDQTLQQILEKNTTQINTLIDKNGKTALMCAATRGHVSIAKKLLENGADPNVINKKSLLKETALHIACAIGNEELVELLVTSGAKINLTNGDYYSTCLSIACASGDYRIAEILLKYGAEVNAKSGGGNTALHFACERGQLDVIRLLLENNANPNFENFKGYTPLHEVKNSNHKSKLMMENLFIEFEQRKKEESERFYSPILVEIPDKSIEPITDELDNLLSFIDRCGNESNELKHRSDQLNAENEKYLNKLSLINRKDHSIRSEISKLLTELQIKRTQLAEVSKDVSKYTNIIEDIDRKSNALKENISKFAEICSQAKIHYNKLTKSLEKFQVKFNEKAIEQFDTEDVEILLRQEGLGHYIQSAIDKKIMGPQLMLPESDLQILFNPIDEDDLLKIFLIRYKFRSSTKASDRDEDPEHHRHHHHHHHQHHLSSSEGQLSSNNNGMDQTNIANLHSNKSTQLPIISVQLHTDPHVDNNSKSKPKTTSYTHHFRHSINTKLLGLKSHVDSEPNNSSHNKQENNLKSISQPEFLISSNNNNNNGNNTLKQSNVRPVMQPDHEVTECKSCSSVFTIINRRHHCRVCGKIFCSLCSSNFLPLPKEFGTVGPKRCCVPCARLIIEYENSPQ